MASIKIKFRPSAVEGREGTIYYQIIHNRNTRHLLSNHHIFPAEWDAGSSRIVIRENSSRYKVLQSIHKNMILDYERFNRIVRRFENIGMIYTADDIVDYYRRFVSEYSLPAFIHALIIRLRLNGKIRTSETYRTTLNSFSKFLRSRSIDPRQLILDCIDSELLVAYESWLYKRGLVPNSISFYTRILRSVYNRAVEADAIENRRPFRHVYTGIDKTIKRALSLAVIRQIKTLDLTGYPSVDYARDIFMLSFMLRGMSFIDMAFLRKSDLINDHIIYRRRKTGQRLIIAWTGDMQAILDKYPENESHYLLPIIRRSCTNERSIYRNVSYNINHNLKSIAGILGLTVPLTLYVARHSWASIARSKGIPISVISEGMGHDNEATTRIYLASLDTALVDRANSLILNSLR